MHNYKTSSSQNLHVAASSQQTTVRSLPEVTKITGVNKITHSQKQPQDKTLIAATLTLNFLVL